MISEACSYSSPGYSCWAIEQFERDTSPAGKLHKIKSLALFRPLGKGGGVLGSQCAKRGEGDPGPGMINHLMKLSGRKSFSHCIVCPGQHPPTNEPAHSPAE